MIFPKKQIAFAVTISILFSSSVLAAESASEQLNKCVKDEQVKKAATGAVIGAATGFLGALAAGKKDKAAAATGLGLVAGAGAGWLQAYMTANQTCRVAHPEWLAESEIARDSTKKYDLVKKEHKYKGKTKAAYIQDITPQLDPNNPSRVTIQSTYDILTPDGAETPVTITRQLFIITKDKTEEVQLLDNRNSEQRTLDVGRNIDAISFNFASPPKESGVDAANIKYRLDITLSIDGKEVSKKQSNIFSPSELSRVS